MHCYYSCFYHFYVTDIITLFYVHFSGLLDTIGATRWNVANQADRYSIHTLRAVSNKVIKLSFVAKTAHFIGNSALKELVAFDT